MHNSPEIYFVTIIGIALGIVLIGFIAVMLVLYKRRQKLQEQEIAVIKSRYEKEVIQSQLEIQENTLKTISQELHDNIGQMLSVVKLSLSAVSFKISKEDSSFPVITNAQDILQKAIYDLSDLTKSLHTDRINEQGLVASIKFELSALKNTGAIQSDLRIIGEEFRLQGQKEIFLFRMFQEMLHNIVKHAQATELGVTLSYQHGNNFLMTIRDNGIGFELEEKRRSADSGVGLRSLYNRAELMGGKLTIDTAINEGTLITVEILDQLN